MIGSGRAGEEGLPGCGQLQWNVRGRVEEVGAQREKIAKSGHWNQKENAKYFAFLTKFKDRFLQKQSRRQWKIFKTLSEFIRTRNANQCRSHHHKMNKNYHTIEETLDALKKKNPFLEERAKKYGEQLGKIRMENLEVEKFHGLFRQNVGLKENESHYVHYSHSNKYKHNIDNPQPQKPQDFSNIPTQSTYLDPHPQQKYSQSIPYICNPNSNILIPQLQQFSSQNVNFFNTNFNFNHHQIKMNNIQMKLISIGGWDREKKLRECHEVFMKWMMKVRSLTQ